MSLTILAPLDGDTVTNPVGVTTAYSLTMSVTLTATVDTTSDPTPPNVSGDGVVTESVSLLAPPTTAVTVSVSTSPYDGGDSQSNVTVTSGEPPVRIDSIDAVPPPPPPPPPPGGMYTASAATSTSGQKKFKVKGKYKQMTTPAVTSVTCKMYKVDVATKSWTEVDSQPGTLTGGGWNATVTYTPDPAFRYVARAFAYNGTTLLGSSSKYNDK